MAQARAGQGLLYHPATSLWLRDQCLGWQWGWHCSPGAARSPSPAEAGGWSCSALMLPPPLPAALHRDPQAGPEVQEPPWTCHILATLSLLEGPQHGTGPSHWPQTTLGPREGAPGMSPSPAWGSPTILWHWHCNSPSQEHPVPAGDAEPGAPTRAWQSCVRAHGHPLQQHLPPLCRAQPHRCLQPSPQPSRGMFLLDRARSLACHDTLPSLQPVPWPGSGDNAQN